MHLRGERHILVPLILLDMNRPLDLVLSPSQRRKSGVSIFLSRSYARNWGFYSILSPRHATNCEFSLVLQPDHGRLF